MHFLLGASSLEPPPWSLLLLLLGASSLEPPQKIERIKILNRILKDSKREFRYCVKKKLL